MAIKFEQLPNPIQAGQIIRAGHVSQSLVAFAGLDAYDINLSGSFAMTGSIYHTEIDDAAGIASSVLVRDNTTGEYYTTGSYASGGGGSGTSGSSGSSGTSGSSGAAGDSGTSGSSGSSGTSGSSGSSGTSGSSGSSGTSGSSGVGGVTTAGSNVTVTGAGTVIDPYVVSSTGGGGGSQNIFTTASVSNSGVKQAAASRIETTTVNDDITFNFINGISGSTDVSTKTLTVSSTPGAPAPELYLRKNEENGTGGTQTLASDTKQTITWKDGVDDYTDNSQWFIVGSSGYFEYDPTLTNGTSYFKILKAGLYEFDLQLKTLGNSVGQNQSCQLKFNRGDLSLNPTITFQETIGMGSYIADRTIARKVSTTFYVSQNIIDLGENIFYVEAVTSVDALATPQSLAVGGGGSESLKGNYCSVKLLRDE